LFQVDAKRVVQSQVEELKREIKLHQSEILKSQSQIENLQHQISTLETQLTEQQISFTKQKEQLQESVEINFDSRLKEEKLKWEEEFSQPIYSTPNFPPQFTSPPGFISSPISSRPSPRNFKSVSPQPELSIKLPPRGGGPPQRTTSYGDISHLRRPSRHFQNPFDSPSAPNLSAPPLEDDDEREFLQSHSRGGSPRNTVVDAVSVSASTSTAGPSVNIMERMSAAVRRLESDLAATKEEMVRCVRQRDEAREECVKLMSEVEEKRKFQSQVTESQNKYNDLENR